LIQENEAKENQGWCSEPTR